MKLRTSPVFYFGILLVAAVVAALAAPFVVDWNRYRPDLEAYGRKLTGRDVAIPGAIEVRLFPWPKLSVRDVRIANPPGFDQPEFARIERVDVKVSLGGLFSGSLDVEAIDLHKPDAALARTIDGRNNWTFAPRLSLGESKVLDHVRLDQIAIHGGALRLSDERRRGALALTGIDGTMSAPAIAGPWRARAIFEADGASYEAGFNSNQWEEGAPLKFAARLAGANFALSFDGASGGAAADGELRLEPGVTSEGKPNMTGPLGRLTARAKVKADFAAIDLKDIEIAQSGGDGRTLEGKARLTLGASSDIEAELASPKFDLTPFAGLALQNDPLGALFGLLKALPSDVTGRGSLKIASLDLGGDTLQNATAAVSFGPGAIRLDEISARLPAQTDAGFSGLFLETPQGPQLAGDLKIETANLKGLAAWAAPDWREAIERQWTGSRGRLKLASRLDAVPGRLRLTGGGYALDGAAGKVTVEKTATETAIRIETELADLDAFRPEGLVPDVRLIDGAALPATNIRLVVQAAKLRLNGVEAEDVALDVTAGPKGFEVPLAEIGKVGEARFESAGTLTFENGAPEGVIEADVAAAHPRGLITLLGLMDGAAGRSWADALGETKLKISGALKPVDGEPAAEITVDGRSGDFAIVGSAGLAGSLDWRAAEIAGELAITSASSRALLRLGGIEALGEADVPGSLKMSAAGSFANGLVADGVAQLFGAEIALQTKPGPEGLNGEASIKTADAAMLTAAAGLPFEAAGPFDAAATFASTAGGLRLDPVTGSARGSAFSGQAYIGGRNLVGRFEADAVSLGPLAAAFSLPWAGLASLEEPFAAGAPFGLTGEIWLNPKSLDVFGLAVLAESQIGITSEPGARRITAYGKTADGKSVTMELGLKPQGEDMAAEAKLALPIALKDALRDSADGAVLDGEMTLDLSLAGAGRSPAGALAAASGSGSYTIPALAVLGLAPEPFLMAAAKAATQPDLDQAFRLLTSGGRIDLGPLAGLVTVVKGRVAFEPKRATAASTDFTLEPRADLASASLDLGIGLSFKSAEALPAMRIGFNGEPRALSRLVESSQLLSALGIQVLKRGVVELERLQMEQQRLAEEEEKQRKEDEARLAAWEYHRREVQSRLREIKMRADQDAAAEAAAEAERKRLLIEGAAINKREKARHIENLREAKRLKRLAEKLRIEAAQAELAARIKAEPGFGQDEPVPVPKAKPKPKLADPIADAKRALEPTSLAAPADKSELDKIIENGVIARP